MKMKLEQIKKDALEIGIKDFYAYVRNFYLQKNGFEKEEVSEDKKEALDELVSRTASFLGVSRANLWEDHAFHMAFRVTDLEELLLLGEEVNEEKVKASLETGREMSILPLNILLGGATIQKFIPDLPELYLSPDPYNIFSELSKIYANVVEDGEISERKYLGSRKFDYAVLANITEFCPVGCAECYKSILTRLSMAALADINPEFAELKRQLNLQEQRAIEQTRLLKEWLNKHPEVDTVIISGGEPLMYSPKTIETILDELHEAKHVTKIRICTAAVYQGLFYKINDELIDVLGRFQDKLFRESRKLFINAHVTDENQLLTPEARLTVRKLEKAGIQTYLQMPLQEGINFYRDDPKKSAEKLAKICDAANRTGAHPYKAIVNMHSPSYKELTVPIERVSQAITFLDEHFKDPDMERWQAYNILHEEGNAYVYPAPNFVAEKDIDRGRGRVTYYIVKLNEDKSARCVHTYEEPLLEGINDGDMPSKINDPGILAKIGEVKEAYQGLRRDEIDTREFYRISGIKFSENEPLIKE